MRWQAVVALGLVGLLGIGCGTTTVITNDPMARIYVDGRMLGRGRGEMNQRGLPGSTQVTVKSDSGQQESQMIERRFTLVTFLTGLISYGVCLIACWEYPSTVYVALPGLPEVGPGGFPVANGRYGAPDPWLMPPPGWGGQSAAPPAAPTAAPTASPPH